MLGLEFRYVLQHRPPQFIDSLLPMVFTNEDFKMRKKTTMRRIRRTKQVDMSPEAVDQRLRDLAQLYKLVPQILIVSV